VPLTTRFSYRHLPHWEVEQGRCFITVRCADSLPRDAILRLQELAEVQRAIAPRSPHFAEHQRFIFRTLEKHLDGGFGACPLKQAEAAKLVIHELDQLREWNVAVPHYSITPNHWHALLVPRSNHHSLSAIMKRVKGRTAKRIQSLLVGRGPVWQREWFDRWIRDDAEWEKCVAYIRNNPVKAGLADAWHEHPRTK
jgi:REP element-mobilizing transposase RayT